MIIAEFVRAKMVCVFLLIVIASGLGCSPKAGEGKGAGGQRFESTWASLQQYEVPDWFRDAKFGIFVHWGPQTLAGNDAAADGSKTRNWKELAGEFRGERFDPEHWAEMFKESGAKYVVQVAEHHDAYALYDSTRTSWSSVKMGPKRDIVGEVAAAVRRRGLIFGCSSHTEENWWFYSDPPKKAPPAPAPGRDPGPQPDKAFLDDWYARLTEINEKYHPQIFWFDWCIEQPVYEPYLRKFASYYYNQAEKRGEGVVLNYKYEAFPTSAAVLDVSVGTSRFGWRPEAVRSTVWQFDTMSNRKYWFWRAGMEMRPAAELIADLADVVSKNGNLLLNVPPAPDGSLTADQETMLREMGRWLSVNGEAIYGTRPWVVYGEGPTEGIGPTFREKTGNSYTSHDVRFTTKGDVLYAIVLGWPKDGRVMIRSLGTGSKWVGREINTVRLLGYDGSIRSVRGADGLAIERPEKNPGDAAIVLKIDWR